MAEIQSLIPRDVRKKYCSSLSREIARNEEEMHKCKDASCKAVKADAIRSMKQRRQNASYNCSVLDQSRDRRLSRRSVNKERQDFFENVSLPAFPVSPPATVPTVNDGYRDDYRDGYKDPERVSSSRYIKQVDYDADEARAANRAQAERLKVDAERRAVDKAQAARIASHAAHLKTKEEQRRVAYMEAGRSRTVSAPKGGLSWDDLRRRYPDYLCRQHMQRDSFPLPKDNSCGEFYYDDGKKRPYRNSGNDTCSKQSRFKTMLGRQCP